MEEAKETLRELKTGIVLFAILAEVGGIWFMKNKPAYGLGVFFGAAVAFGLSIHMFRTLEIGLDLDEKSATSYIRRKTVLRIVIMGVAVALACLFPAFLDVIGVLLGLLGLKVSAYLQPVIHKYVVPKIIHKGR